MFASPFDDPCLTWVKSTYSGGANNDCVEFARVPGLIGVRDSKDPEGAKLALSVAGMRACLDEIKAAHVGR